MFMLSQVNESVWNINSSVGVGHVCDDIDNGQIKRLVSHRDDNLFLNWGDKVNTDFIKGRVRTRFDIDFLGFLVDFDTFSDFSDV